MKLKDGTAPSCEGQGEEGGRAQIQSPETKRLCSRKTEKASVDGGGGGTCKAEELPCRASDTLLSMDFTAGPFQLGSNMISYILKLITLMVQWKAEPFHI